MSGTEDCTSQEIEASTPSNSTRNSIKCTFVKSILNTEESQIACSSASRIILGGERVPQLPTLKKNDFIQNWIDAHSSLTEISEKSCPASPVLGISSAKRSPQSPILGYQWKRIKQEEDSKENCRVSLNEKFQQLRPDPLITRITIEQEICLDNKVYENPKSTNSPVFNKITNSPSLSTSPCRFGATKSARKFDEDSTLKWIDGKCLIRENTEIPETLSLSSPLCKRNNPFKNANFSRYCEANFEALNKQLLKKSELLVDESPYDVEIISSSSKIPETLSYSTIDDGYRESKTNFKKSPSPEYDFRGNKDISELQKLHRRPSSSSSIKIETETSSDDDRRSQRSDSSNSSVRLSIPSPFKKKKLIANKSCNGSLIRGKTSPVKCAAVETLQGFDDASKKIAKSSSIPDTLSVSSQLRETLVPESSNFPYQLSIPSALRKKKLIANKSCNAPLIRGKISPVKCAAVETLQGFDDASKKIAKSSSIPDTLSVSSQLRETLVPESSNFPYRLSIPSALSNNLIGSRPEVETLHPEFPNASNHSSIHSSLRLKRKKLTDTKSDRASSINEEIIADEKSTATETVHESKKSKKNRTSYEIPETLSVSSQLNEILEPESSNSPNLLSLSASLAKNMHVGITSVKLSMMRVKDSSMTFDAFNSADDKKRAIQSEETLKLSKDLSQIIDVESCTTNAPEDDIKIESDSDCTISDFIENPVTQNAATIAIGKSCRAAKNANHENHERPQNFDDRISNSPQNRSCDSDETYYSDGDSVHRSRISEASPLRDSQKISQSTPHSHESRIISEAASLGEKNNCQPPSYVTSRYAINNNSGKKKKVKKGSLVAKLQTIVNSQVSKLRIWRYQLSRPDFNNTRTHFVKMKIRERETRYGRHYLTASVIEDSHELLKNIFQSDSNLSSDKNGASFEIGIVTLLIVPEIVGIVKIPANSTVKVYPPWEIMDRNKKILNVVFFNVDTPEDVDSKAIVKRASKNVIQDFECPCLRAKTLVDSCPVKFTNTKTSVMQIMFNS